MGGKRYKPHSSKICPEHRVGGDRSSTHHSLVVESASAGSFREGGRWLPIRSEQKTPHANRLWMEEGVRWMGGWRVGDVRAWLATQEESHRCLSLASKAKSRNYFTLLSYLCCYSLTLVNACCRLCCAHNDLISKLPGCDPLYRHGMLCVSVETYSTPAHLGHGIGSSMHPIRKALNRRVECFFLGGAVILCRGGFASSLMWNRCFASSACDVRHSHPSEQTAAV